MKRTKLFKLQGLLAIFLIIIATVQTALQSTGVDLLKIAIAPFGAVSLLLFAFFVYNRKRDELDDEESFPLKRILINFGLVILCGVVVIFLTSLIDDLTSTLDRVLFCFSMLIAAVLFLYEKIRSFRSMAILTGIAEGAAILLLFFR